MAIRRKLFASLTALLGLALSGVVQATADLNMRPGVTETSLEAYDLHMMVVWVMTVIAVVVFGLMFYSIIFHRRSKNPTPATWSHSTTVEFIWTAIPFIILIALTIPAVKLLIKMEDASNPDMSVQITGSQWKWHYKYLDHNIEFFSNLNSPQQTEHFEQPGIAAEPNYLLDVDNELVIPANKKVRFLVTADDVIHSWWVPELAVKKDAIPGFINETWTKVPKPGVYRGQCTELCGKWHGFMPVVVRVVTEAEFDQWVAKKNEERLAAEKAAAEAAAKSWDMDKLMALGKETYDAKCAACHQVDGSGTPPLFPAMIDSPMVKGPAKDHIDIVVNGKAGTAMAAYGAQLTDAELAAVITYERNAWGNNTGDKVQPADIQAFKAGN
ncbi:cytochrome c oxidase subunit II [Aliikangiella coralliicola]|uniref:Cytochrome c oxidase subunit 2 n=1 Tax=Aliikangiella coralliicola TaxID=2592383 RepID=A0A545UH53_9GAMM|nr:cytochrome c oxidase subunit II [Aliikangiella coralliicola]TQV88801.1 cytochrome c oxidase subunit II [Aliikangiella coralliicola]